MFNLCYSFASADTIDPKQLEILRSEISKLEKLWRKRRSQCKEMIGNIAEGLDKKDNEVCVGMRILQLGFRK